MVCITPKTVTKAIYNMWQFLMWGVTLYLIHSYLTTGSPKCWKDCLQIAQYSQAFDIVLSLIGWTNNSVLTVAQ